MMNKRILFLSAAALLGISVASVRTNPVAESILSEVYPDPGSPYVIEFHGVYWMEDYGNLLDGFIVSNSTGDHAVLPGKQLADDEYIALTSDDFDPPLSLDTLVDFVSVTEPLQGLGIGYVNYGADDPFSIRCPYPGQSISGYFGGYWLYYWYIDGSPTYGAANDTIDAMGALMGKVVEEGTDDRIEGAVVILPETGQRDTTDSLGVFYFLCPARNYMVSVKAPGYEDYFPGESVTDIYPDSLTIFNIELTPRVGIDPHDPGSVDFPKTYQLAQNFPNPFNPSTTITFDVPGSSDSPQMVSLIIYNVHGRIVKTLVDGELPPGSHRVRWDGRDSHGIQVTSGVYFYTLRSGYQKISRKMTMLK